MITAFILLAIYSAIVTVIFVVFFKNAFLPSIKVLKLLEAFRDNLNYYQEHLEGLYKNSEFFGDPVLQKILSHTKEIENDINIVKQHMSYADFNKKHQIDEEKREVDIVEEEEDGIF